MFRHAFPRTFRLPRRLTAGLTSVTTGVVAGLVSLALVSPALAQTTREEQLAAERADKAAHLHPYELNTLERRIDVVDRFISTERPVYLVMGSAFEGAGVAFGPGVRARYGDSGRIDARATWSISNYKTASGTVALPSFAHDRINVDVHGSWIDAPRVRFYGTGHDSLRDDKTDFAYRSATVGATGTVKAGGGVSFGATLDAIDTRALSSGATAALEPTYRRTAVNAQFDSRTAPEYSRRGSLARVEWADLHQTNGGTHDFQRVDAEVQQLVPLMRENWVLAFRALASTTMTDEGNDVPFFLMPELGGSTLLRGFPAWRFRDRHRLLLSGEYRWSAGPLVDMAVFVDAGKVAASRADLNLWGLAVSQGVGLRIHTPSATVTRVEVARSREGTSLIVAFSPSF